nr:dihydromonapterin reductase [Oceanococcus sp. HetDA_MAG_MS8]
MKTGHVLITGVGRRAGLFLAQTMLQRGIPVIGTFRTEYPSLEKLRERGAELHRCDFNDEGSVHALIEAVQAQHADLRCMIHNASQWLSDSADLALPEIMATMMRVHVGVPYQLNMSLAALLQKHPGAPADIIHIGDYVSSHGSKKHIAYAASKAAQDNLTMSFAQKLAPKIKVNSIAPALLLFNEGDDEAYQAKAKAKSLMEKEGGFGELQATVDYLMQSEYITGRVLALDGGRHLR